MADITQNPPKDETTPGQTTEARKSSGADKTVATELKKYGDTTKEIANDAKKGLDAIIEGIQQGNRDMNPEKDRKIQVSGFKDLSAAQENVVELFTDMKNSSEKSSAAMTKELVGDKGQKLEDQKEQVGLWQRMLLRLIGIDEELDRLYKSQISINKEGEMGWGLRLFIGAVIGALLGLAVGITVGIAEAIIAWTRLFRIAIVNSFKGGKTSSLMGRIWASITGFFTNLALRMKIWGTNKIRNFKGFIEPMTKMLGRLNRAFFGAFTSGFKGEKTFMRASGRMGSTASTVLGQLGAFVSRTLGLFKNLGQSTGYLSSVLGTGTKAGKTIGGTGSTLIRLWRLFQVVFNPMWAGFKAVFGVFVKFGRVIGRFFLPLTIVMGLVDGIRGFIDGFKNTEGGMFSKIIGGITGAIKGIVNGLIMMPLDLLKKGVAWILGKFGFEDAKASLESFSFKDIFSNIMDSIKNMFLNVIDFFKSLFTGDWGGAMSALGNIGNMIANFYKMILRWLLPDPTKERGLLNPLRWVAAAIPDGIYKWAGIDPETGEQFLEYTTDGSLGKIVKEDDLSLTGQVKDGLQELTVTAKKRGSEFIDETGNNVNAFIEGNKKIVGDTVINVIGGVGGNETAAAVTD